MSNPYLDGVQFSTPRTEVATELRLPGSNERMVGAGGELNANSKKDLLNRIGSFSGVVQAGTEVITEAKAVDREQLKAKHHNMVLSAFDSGEQLSTLGEVMADELYIASNRDGFARRFLSRQELTQGNIPHIRMRMKDVVAVIASSASRIETQIIRDQDHYPPEFYITARPYIEKREIDRSKTDVLEEKYIEALEALMVGEDRTWKRLALATVGVANPQSNIVGSMTPTALGNLRNRVSRWQIPARYWLIANDLWTDIIADPGFQAIIDPVSKYELLLAGELANIIGLTVVSDAFRHPAHKVLDSGEMYVIGDPINHGQYTDRGGVDSQPIDGTHENIPGRGWMMSESLSMVIANARSVARGVRVA